MKKCVLVVLCVLLTVTSLGAAGNSETKAASVAKTYVFAADATWPPLEFIDEKGAITGFEVELVPLIGKAVGLNMVVKNVPWDTIFAGLANGAYDGVASGVTITEERRNTMDFSAPILSNGQVVIIPSSSAGAIHGVDDLAGGKVGVQIGTTGDFSLEKYPVEIKRYDDIGLAIEDMVNGNLSACVCDSLIASDFVLSNESYKGKLSLAGEPFTREDIAIAVKKGNSVLLDAINSGLSEMESDGSLKALKEKWHII